jgi:N-acetylmuramoyl-L-alanine amidase
MHYLGVPGQSAHQARAYFESLKTQDAADEAPDRSASAHYIVDHDGTVLYVVPRDEKAYHVGSSVADPASGKIYTDLARRSFGDYAKYPEKSSPNSCTVGIELCHGRGGEFSEATIIAAAELAAMLCKVYRLDPVSQIFTHHEIVGWKNCPEYWVKRPTLFESFKLDVRAKLTKEV